METWVRDGNGKARQKGATKDLLDDPRLEIPIGDILPPPYSGPIVVDLDNFRFRLPFDIRRQAYNRCHAAVAKWHQKQGFDSKDRDCEQ